MMISTAHAAELVPSPGTFVSSFDFDLGLDTIGYLRASDDAPRGFHNQVMPEIVGHARGEGTREFATQAFSGSFVGGLSADAQVMLANLSRDGAWGATYAELPEIYTG